MRIKQAGLLFCLLSVMSSSVEVLGQGNYVRTTTYFESDGSRSAENYTYYDGFGRKSGVTTQGVTSDGSYLHTQETYYPNGRPYRSWSPINVQSSSWSSNFTTISGLQYSDSYGYVEYEYDGLGRVIGEGIPGSAWYLNGRRTVKSYGLNTSADRVRKYSVSLRGTTLIGGSSYHAAGTLKKETVTDADSRTVTLFTDMKGRKVLERMGSDNDTYYVYDDKDQLRYVLSPSYQDNPDAELYAYYYEYDGRGRCTKKRLPGCSAVTYKYNQLNLVSLMQDGVLASRGLYRFFIYDGQGRLCLQGTTSTNATPGLITGYNGTFLGTKYEVGSFASPPPTTTLEIVNYYDDLSYLTLYRSDYGSLVDSLASANVGVQPGNLMCQVQRASNGEQLLHTYAYDAYGYVKCEREIGLGKWYTAREHSVSFTGRIDRTSFREYSNTSGSLTRMASGVLANTYDFQHSDNLHLTSLSLSGRTGSTQSKTIQNLSYDSRGNVSGIDRDGSSADMTYQYDLLHGWVRSISSGGGFQQTLYRQDNATGRLYDGSISAMAWSVPGENQTRRYDYSYDALGRLTNAFYTEPSGASMSSAEPVGTELTGALLMQSLIPDAEQAAASATNKYGEEIGYDRNSNVTSLKRRGMLNNRSYGLIDDLSIGTSNRTGNRLKKVDDAVTTRLTYTGASDFVNGTSSAVEYEYDSNGALTKDLNRGISSIVYDNLGHLQSVTFSSDSRISYVYSADGRKLRTVHTSAGTPATTTTRDYRGNLVVENTNLSRYDFAGGYVTFLSNAVSGWHYYIQDYQGNNRMVVKNDGTVEQRTHYYPYGGVIGDIGSGADFQRSKFLGKELDRSYGLDWYDDEARMYDGIGVPAFTSMDPLTEKYYHLSPYSYCGGDPVNSFDPNGKDRYAITSLGYIYYQGSDNNKYITLYRDGCPDIEPYIVPEELTKVITDMAETQTKKYRFSSNKAKYFNNRKTHFATTQSQSVYELFAWIVDSRTCVEWRLDSYEDTYLIGTQHQDNPANGIDDLSGIVDGTEKEKKTTNMHNHLLGGTEGPSDSGNGQGDIYSCRINPNPLYFVVVPQEKGPANVYKYSYSNGINKSDFVGTSDNLRRIVLGE